MSPVRPTKDMVWQGFTKHFAEIQSLQNELCQIASREKTIREKIDEKKAFLEHLTKLTWKDLEEILAGRVLQNHASGKVAKTANQKPFQDGTRLWVLKAIAHYEDHNRESHINERSIRIYINAQCPGFFTGHWDTILYCALAYLCRKELITKTKLKATRQTEYALTEKGRQAIANAAGANTHG